MPVSTYTIEINSNPSMRDQVSGAKVHFMGTARKVCVVATATQKTVDLVKQEAGVEANRTAELAQELKKALQAVGFQTVADFQSSYKSKNIPVRMVEDIRLQVSRINKRRVEAANVRNRNVFVGEQIVVSWTMDVEGAQKSLAKPKARLLLAKGYTLEIRTDFEVVTKATKAEALSV